LGKNSYPPLGISECPFCNASFPLPLTFPQVHLHARRNVFCQAAEPSQGYMQEPHRKVNISEQIFKHNNTKAGAII